MLFVTYGDGVVWPDADLTYSYSNLLDGSWASGLNTSQITQGAEEAMGVWAAVTPLTFTQTGDSGPLPTSSDDTYPQGTTPDIRWGHHLLDGPPVMGMPNTLAHAYSPGTGGRNGDIHFDNGDTFTITNFLQTATHEIGHSLGLDHTNGDVADYDMDGDTECPVQFPAIMHACIGGGTNPTTMLNNWAYSGFNSAYLLQDDVNGMQSLYDAGLGYVLNSTGQLSVYGTQQADIFSVHYEFGTGMLTVTNLNRSFTRSLAGVTQIAINAGDGSDVIFVDALPSNIITVVNGGAGSDSLTIRGGSGSDTLQLLNGTTATNNSAGILFNSIAAIALSGLDGADVIEIVQTPLNLPVTINGGNHNDHIYLANGGSTNAIRSAVTINGDGGSDTAYLALNAPGGISVIDATVAFNGGAGGDTLVVGSGSLSAVSGLVTYNAGALGEGNAMILNDSGNAFFVDYYIGETSITRDTPFFFAGVNYSGVGSITLHASDGPNVVTIDAVSISSAIVNGNGGDDNFVVGNGNNLAGGIGLFTGNGGPGLDTLTLNDSLSTHDLPWAILGDHTFDPQTVYLGFQAYDLEGYEGVTVLAGNGSNNVQINGTMAQDVTLHTGGGNDVVEINDISTFRDFFTQNEDPPFNHPMTIDGGSGFNILTIDDLLSIDRSYIIHPDQITAFEGAPLGMRFNYDSFGAVNLYAGQYVNDYLIFGTSPDIPAGQQMTILGGPQADFFEIRPHDDQGNLTINGNLGISGAGGIDSLVVNDTFSSLPINYVFSNQFGPGTTNISGLGAAGFGAGSNIENLTVSAGGGNDTFAINTFQSGSALTINGGEGDDVLNYGTNTVANITNMASFQFSGQGGYDTFNFNNSANTAAWTYNRNLNGLAATSSLGASYSLAESSVERMQIFGGSQADSFYANTVAVNTELNAYGGGGVDGLALGFSSNSVDTIRGRVRFFGEEAGGHIAIYDQLDTSADLVHLSKTELGAAPGDSLFGPDGAMEFYDLVNFIDGIGMRLLLGSGGDTVFVQPLTTARVLVSGNNPATAPGDSLVLQFTGVTSPVFTPGGVGTGTYAFVGAQPVGYSGIETATAAYPGDFSLDGSVGAEDYEIWKSTWGTMVVPGTAGDANWDGQVNLADYTTWRDNLGQSFPDAQPLTSESVDAASGLNVDRLAFAATTASPPTSSRQAAQRVFSIWPAAAKLSSHDQALALFERTGWTRRTLAEFNGEGALCDEDSIHSIATELVFTALGSESDGNGLRQKLPAM